MKYKYIDLANQIREDIDKNYSDGDKYLSNRELQSKFNVSSITIMKALDKIISDGVLVPNVGIGMFVSKNANTNSKLVNYLMVYDRDIHGDEYSNSVYANFLKASTNRNIAITYAYYADLNKVTLSNTDGVIFLSPINKYYNYINSFVKKDIPMLVFADHSEELKVPTVDSDIEDACEKIVADIASKNRKSIAYVTYPNNKFHTILRKNMIRSLAEGYNIKALEENVISSNYHTFEYENKKSLFKVMDKKDYPDVLVFDTCALSLNVILDYIKDLNIKIGSDLLVYCFDKMNSKYFTDNLVSYAEQPIYKMALSAIDCLDAQRNNKEIEKNKKLPCKLHFS